MHPDVHIDSYIQQRISVESQFLFCTAFVCGSQDVSHSGLGSTYGGLFWERWFSQHGWILVVQVPALQLSGWTIRAKMTDYTATRSERIGQGPVEHLRVPREISPFPRMQRKPELDLLEEGFHPDPVSSSPSSWMEGFAEPLQGHAPELQLKSLRGLGFWKGSLSSYSSTV